MIKVLTAVKNIKINLRKYRSAVYQVDTVKL